jgi:hypothetical protein
MVAALQFFSDFAALIFLLLLVGAMFAIRGLVRARRERLGAVFGLETELARRHTRQAVAMLSIIGFLVLAEFVVVVFLTPILPALAILSRSTENLGALPADTIPPEILQTLNATTPVATSTAESSGCIPAQIMLSFPASGQEIRGKITLIGTADIPNFGFYKYEFAPVGVDVWATIQAGRVALQNDELGAWDTSELTPGDYLLRLVVTDNQGQALPACVVPVRIRAP